MLHTPNTTQNVVNGIDVAALGEVMTAIEKDPTNAMVAFRVTSDWMGQTRSQARIESYTIGGETVPRTFKIDVDEPLELLGQNTAPNPQEMLMTAFNACIMVGYVAGAAVNGITLESVQIETSGELDLRGFLGMDETVKPGYDLIKYVVRIKGYATESQFHEIHETVKRTSPNYFNISRPVTVDARMEILS